MSRSLSRLVVTAVRVEGRSKAEVARDLRLSRQWVHELCARFEAEGEEAGCEGVDPALQLRIGPAHILVAHDKGVRAAPARDRLVEINANRLADERHRRGAVDIALGQLGHTPSSRGPTAAG